MSTMLIKFCTWKRWRMNNQTMSCTYSSNNKLKYCVVLSICFRCMVAILVFVRDEKIIIIFRKHNGVITPHFVPEIKLNYLVLFNDLKSYYLQISQKIQNFSVHSTSISSHCAQLSNHYLIITSVSFAILLYHHT